MKEIIKKFKNEKHFKMKQNCMYLIWRYEKCTSGFSYALIVSKTHENEKNHLLLQNYSQNNLHNSLDCKQKKPKKLPFMQLRVAIS